MAGTLIVALDVDTRREAAELVRALDGAADFFKIGYQLFYGGDGFALGKELLAAGKRVFFDLKLLDIDNTVERGVAAIARTGATMLTVHAYPQCMRAALKGAAGSHLTVLGGVVEVDVKVALRPDANIQQRVLGKLVEHVIEEADPGLDVVSA